MKKYCAITLLFLMVFTLSACSKSNTATCSYCSAKIDAMESYCQSCGKPLSSMKPDGYEDAMDEYDTNPFEGLWRYEEYANGLISFDMSSFYFFEFESSGKIVEYSNGTYNYTDGELITKSKDGAYLEEEKASYTFSNDLSSLTISFEDETLKLKRLSGASYDKSIVGHWTTHNPSSGIKLRFANTTYTIKELFFYKDGSYKFIDTYNESLLSGNYEIVHDGKGLRIDNTDTEDHLIHHAESYNINILSNGLMILNNQYDDCLLKRVD